MTDDQAAEIREALVRADESLALLESVPIANTTAARTAMTQTRLSVLERFHEEVKVALGRSGSS